MLHLLMGRRFWRRAIDFDALVEEGVISPEDLQLMDVVKTAEEAWKIIRDFYRMPHPLSTDSYNGCCLRGQQACRVQNGMSYGSSSMRSAVFFAVPFADSAGSLASAFAACCSAIALPIASR